MQPRRESRSLVGFDLMLIGIAVTLALVCLSMMFEMSGASGDRIKLFAFLLLPPVLGLTFVHWRDGAPRSAPVRIRRPHDGRGFR